MGLAAIRVTGVDVGGGKVGVAANVGTTVGINVGVEGTLVAGAGVEHATNAISTQASNASMDFGFIFSS